MNLIKDVWLPIVRRDGTREEIAIHQLLDDYQKNPVIELEVPRPDFRNAIYQLLIGIVQVAAMPDDEEHWAELFEKPYSSTEFSQMVLKYEDCFEIDSEGPAFMQDYDMPDGEEKPISALLIESPGKKTESDNTDHFVKRRLVNSINPYWAAIALYTLQTFAPSGGQGHRVGLRGGGPLTTMIVTAIETDLWKKICINLVSKDFINILSGDSKKKAKQDIFPWLKETKISVNGCELFSQEVHPFAMYFGMPRRIRLNIVEEEATCDLTNKVFVSCVRSYHTLNFGNNYGGVWTHPLNAYNINASSDGIPLSVKAQPGGVGYRHWIGQAVSSKTTIVATVVNIMHQSDYRKKAIKKYGALLWLAGFDMDNMKARCWYESMMPVFSLSQRDVDIVSSQISKLIEVTSTLSKNLKSRIKEAWCDRPKDLGGDISFIDNAFWANTESAFYSLLNQYINNIENYELHKKIADYWSTVLSKEVYSLFDQYVLAAQEDGLDLKRVVKAKLELNKSVSIMKKNLIALFQEEQ